MLTFLTPTQGVTSDARYSIVHLLRFLVHSTNIYHCRYIRRQSSRPTSFIGGSFSLEDQAVDKRGVSRLLTRRLHPGHRRDQVTTGACECQGTLEPRSPRGPALRRPRPPRAARQSQPTCLRARPPIRARLSRFSRFSSLRKSAVSRQYTFLYYN